MKDRILHHLRNGTAPWVALNLTRSLWETVCLRGHAVRRDMGNGIRYGRRGPRFSECIWVDATRIHRYIRNEEILRITGEHRNLASGRVVEWRAVERILPLDRETKIRLCTRHWRDGEPWEALGYIDLMQRVPRHLHDSHRIIAKRLAMLDRAFEEARMTGTLKTRQQLNPRNFREYGGVLVHIGEDGEPVFGGNGFHRLAIAKVLNLRCIPACVGVVAHSALPWMERYRTEPLTR